MRQFKRFHYFLLIKSSDKINQSPATSSLFDINNHVILNFFAVSIGCSYCNTLPLVEYQELVLLHCLISQKKRNQKQLLIKKYRTLLSTLYWEKTNKKQIILHCLHLLTIFFYEPSVLLEDTFNDTGKYKYIFNQPKQFSSYLTTFCHPNHPSLVFQMVLRYLPAMDTTMLSLP